MKNRDNIIVNTISGLLVLFLSYCFVQLVEGISKLSFGNFFDRAKSIFGFLGYRYRIDISLPIFSILISVFTSISMVLSSKKLLQRYLGQRRKLQILEARYYTPKNSVDITDDLNSKISGDKLKVNLTNDIAGDPDKGVNKEGKVKYIYNRKEFERNYKEWDLIDLP